MLDTHIALWAVADDPVLSGEARDLIGDAQNEIFVSAASIWEIAIKYALRRGGVNDMPLSGAEALHYFGEAGYGLLAISPAHAAAVDGLPPLHADPFDRMLVAQARIEPLRLMTHDARLKDYGDGVMVV